VTAVPGQAAQRLEGHVTTDAVEAHVDAAAVGGFEHRRGEAAVAIVEMATSAPRLRAKSSFSGPPAVAITRAPAATASCTAC